LGTNTVTEHIFPKGLEGGAHYFALPKGSKLFEFEIVAVLGHGGFGITYLAMDTHLQEQVAIKEYLPSDLAVRISDRTVRPKSADDKPSFEEGLKAFLKEAQLVARTRHTNIVRVRRFFEAHGTGYIVQDFEEGKTLGQRLSEGPLPEAELRVVVAGVLDGLKEVHERAVLHRDLKPNNIMLRGNGTPVLIDFGAARDFRSRHSRSITAIATPGYTPPEQYGVGGQQGPWSDLYALGAILYRCVTGAAPLDSLQRLRHDRLVPASVAAVGRYDAALLGTIDWMLRIDEAERPASVQAVRAALASGQAPEQDRQKSTLSLTIKPAGAGRVLIELPESVHADWLELAFFVTPPGRYLTPSLGGRPVWRNQAYYFEVYRTAGEAGHATFEVGSEIVSAIAAQAQVTISSAYGFIHGSSIWPAHPVAEKPKRRWALAAALMILALIALPAAGFGLYTSYQKQQAERPGELRSQAQTRINTIEEKERHENAVLSECDRLAAHPFDMTRPAGVFGIRLDQIDAAQAVPACRVALAILPNDARVAFQLGRAVDKAGDGDEAVRLYRKAAEGGSTAALNNLGLMLVRGVGIAKDEAEAVRWYRKAADAGYAPGMNNLGIMYQTGSGVRKDEVEAVHWYRQAADSGFPDAMFNLGVMYATGRGVEKDTAEAIRWYRKAAAAGDEDAKAALSRLAK
jgi:serine/threonine protein kinase